ncbi:MAG: molybdenum cofactor biosynthesis protein MoaE [Methylococcales bacterium]|jgi:molybdopterin synthase catalytic subunit|nr:molybdenum cofactor biosynthesis protein MoaE [Methylococcales bacterium]MBT7411211.1 molybdenum cofactor biosynthesis protein MoaE [Methylococcales bacterium]
MLVKILESELNPWAELESYNAHKSYGGKTGAIVTFLGFMRDFNEGDDVVSMSLEHYPGMTEKTLEKLLSDTRLQWDLLDALIIHRVGNLKPEDAIVLVATWSSHRKEAYESNRYIMETLKTTAPFWKKENLLDGSSRWVGKNTPG